MIPRELNTPYKLITASLFRVRHEGEFKKGYRDFRRAVVNGMPPDRRQNYFRVGEINRTFERQKPFAMYLAVHFLP